MYVHQIEPRHEKKKKLFMPYANNEGADQPAHLRSLINTFVIHCLDSRMSLVFISEIFKPLAGPCS